VAFVIDSSSGMMDDERSILQIFEDLTHGQVVRTILERWGVPDKLHFHAVDNAGGTVDRERYLFALGRIASHLRDKPGDRVVINISLGSHSPGLPEKQLIREILGHGAIVVASAGNHGSENSVYPAALEGVICVGASDKGVRQDYSNYGAIDVFADGSYHILQRRALPSDTGIRTHARTVWLNGTSFAAPRVAGLIVKMLQLKPSLGNQMILETLQTTSDDVLGFEQGSVNRLNALAAISDKYAALREVQQACLVLLEAVCIIVLVGIGLLIVIPMPEFLFRVLFPSHWVAIKMRHIDKIVTGKRRRPREFRYIIDCLLPGYGSLFDRAREVLLGMGEPAVKHLVRAYPYKAHDEFGDFKTCVYRLIEEIGGSEAAEFLQSEQECEDPHAELPRGLEGAGGQAQEWR